MTLRAYRSKRDFGQTPEPDGRMDGDRRPGRIDEIEAGGRHVIHRHRARRLHYDLRLEIAGSDPSTALRAGELKCRLVWEKLHGGFVLIRTDRWGKSQPTKPKWLLIHRRDDAAISGWDADDHPASVKSGRTNQDVADGRRATRRGRRPKAR